MPDGVTTSITRLPDGELGCYAHDDRSIHLDPRLSSTAEKCTLAHEIVHAERGDVCLAGETPDADRLDLRQERDVQRIASARLVEINDLSRAIARTADLEDAAEELGVDEDTLWHRLDALTDDEKDLLQQRVEAIEEASWPTT